MDNNVEKFLLDVNDNDKVFKGTYAPKKINKEKYDDRFTIIYTKTSRDNSLAQENYEVAGYLDIKDKILYDYNYDIRDLLPNEKSLIEQSSFSVLGQKIDDEIEKYIEKYSFDNEIKLKNIALEKYNQFNDWEIDRYKKDVRELFIEEDEINIKLGKSYSTYKLANSHSFNSKNVYLEYLNNPDKTIEKYSMEIINKCDDFDNNKLGLGLELLIYYDKIKYLNEILKNEKDQFHDLYINKKMYQSIKDLDAKTINITIQYGENDLTFKYDYHILKRDLLDDDKGSNAWGVAYEKVSDFIKENTNKLESRGTEEFLFSHVTLITYGKKELYKNNLDNEISKEVEQEDLEIEM